MHHLHGSTSARLQEMAQFFVSAVINVLQIASASCRFSGLIGVRASSRLMA